MTSAEKIQFISNELQLISSGRILLEDLYKDNGRLRTVGVGNFTQEKYDAIVADRTDVLKNYTSVMSEIIADRSTEQSDKDSASTLLTTITNESKTATRIEVRFTTFQRYR
jgi:hypothetical protein